MKILMLTLISWMVSAILVSAQTAKAVTAELIVSTDRQPAPGFALFDAAGKTVRLTDYRGSVVLLDFWATTCGGCVEEIPMFIEVSKTFEAAGLVAVGVAEDIPYAELSGPTEAWARVKPFVRDHHMNYPVVMGDADVLSAYEIQSLPLTFLVDRRGRIAARYQGVVDRENLIANIKRLLAEAR